MSVDWTGLLGLLGFVSVLGFFFAKVEVQVEGKDGWAASLPTWRIEKHWLLDVFWGGRPMTGYHFWVFTFVALAMHLGFFITCTWSLKLECRAVAAGALFWIVEDFLWFILNPAFGLRAFKKGNVQWHPRWFCGLPLDYWVFGIGGIATLLATFITRLPK